MYEELNRCTFSGKVVKTKSANGGLMVYISQYFKGLKDYETVFPLFIDENGLKDLQFEIEAKDTLIIVDANCIIKDNRVRFFVDNSANIHKVWRDQELDLGVENAAKLSTEKN